MKKQQPIRCKARYHGSQCTLLENHNIRDLTHTFVMKRYGEKPFRFNIDKIKGFDPFYEVYECRKCNLKICDCKCIPIPCPFCVKEFGFTQDWNIHLRKYHKEMLY